MAADETIESTPTPETAPAESPVDFADLNAPLGDLDLPPVVSTEKPPAKASETPPASTHPQALIEAAREAGFSDRAISKLDTDSLYEVLVNQNRKLAELAASRPQPQRREERRDTAVDEYESELNEIETEVQAPKLSAFNRKLAAEMRQMKANEADRQKRETERRNADIIDSADEAIESLGTSLGRKFSNEQKSALFRAAGIDGTESSRVVKRKITDAGLTLFQGLEKKKPVAPPATNGKKPTAEELDNSRLPAPTSSLPSRAKGDRAAALAIRDKMLQMNLHGNVDRDEYEGVPE